MVAQVVVLGVRHHGPGSARAVARALDDWRPDAVLIEGPPELDAVAPLASAPQMRPPVAGLVYVPGEPRRAAFYPMAAFSPEWVALRWALAAGIDVGFADLPAANGLAAEGWESDGVEPDGDDHDQGSLPIERSDPIGALAAAAGYDDPERWWEDSIEHRRHGLEVFESVASAMASLREGQRLDRRTLAREAAMRRILRKTMKTHERVAFVCGAYHAPVLVPDAHPTQASDTALLKGLAKTKVAATWAPWTAARLAFASGYGAGVTSPGWYQHLFVTDDDVIARWMVRVAGCLRDEGLDASSAALVEATRLADALAAIRGRPLAGLAEVTDAVRAALCNGSDMPLRLVSRRLVVGESLGTVPDDTPQVPLARDLDRQQKTHRLTRSSMPKEILIDLRRPSGLARSEFLHRLGMLHIDWGQPAETGRSTGTFKEAWLLEWQPELAVTVIEASLYGTTIVDAATAKVAEQAGTESSLRRLTELVERCLLAGLPGALAEVIAELGVRTARQHDTLAMLDAIEPLARTARYGDVRAADTSDIAGVFAALVVRAAVGLPAACAALDDDAASALRAGIEGTHRAVALVGDEEVRAAWTHALASVAVQVGVHGSVAGRVNRLLLDGGVVETDEAGRRLSRVLSRGADPADGAAWLDGFLAGDIVLLLHDDELLAVIDSWVRTIPADVFDDLLPLLRRTFSRFDKPERRQLKNHLQSRDSGDGVGLVHDDDIDADRAAPAVATVFRLLGVDA